MPLEITATEQKLKNVFSDAYLFDIPVYQRPYAWTTEQASELLDDLTNAMNADPEAPYFLGSIVLVKDGHDSRSAVVDGQQRLTTLAMLLCILRDLATTDGQAEALDEFVRQAGNPFRGTEDRFRLRLRERDQQFFDRRVQDRNGTTSLLAMDPSGLTDTQQLMFGNIKALKTEIENLDATEREAFSRFVVQHCYLVVVTATDRNSAYRIFSVMNDRGLDLRPTDILKAEIIGTITQSRKTDYARKWEDTEESLGRDRFRDLFAHIRMIRLKSKLRSTLQADFENKILTKVSGAAFIDDVLEPYASVYSKLVTSSYVSERDANPVNSHLRHLGRLDNFDWLPPAMEFFLRAGDKGAPVLWFTKDLERLAYGLFVLRRNVNQRIQRYGEVLRWIERGEDLDRETSPLQLDADEITEIRQRLNGPVYLATARVTKALLLRLDSALAEAGGTYEQSGVRYEPGIISVEHVLPQQPGGGSQWLDWFSHEEDRMAVTHRLGNLVLLSRRKNNMASNFEFERKKREYFFRDGATPFVLTNELRAVEEWREDELNARQERLFGKLVEEWRL